VEDGPSEENCVCFCPLLHFLGQGATDSDGFALICLFAGDFRGGKGYQDDL